MSSKSSSAQYLIINAMSFTLR